MTRLTDGHTTPNRPLPSDSNTNVLRRESLPQVSVPVAPTTMMPAANDRLSDDRVGARDLPGHVASGLPGEGEPEGRPDDAAMERVGERLATVFGHRDDGEQTNRLMRRIAILEATRNNVERGVDRDGGLANGQRGLPAGQLSLNGDGSITTPGGFTVLNDGGHNWRIREPSGREHRIWGDPHVDENNDGKDDWHFNRDASFILPDGAKIFCNTSQVSQYGGAAVTVSDQLHVQYGESLGTMDVRNGGPGTVGTGGERFDRLGRDGQLFVLAEDSRFVAGNTLGDLYDKGGDFAADISLDNRGNISDSARIALGMARETGPTRTAQEWREEANHGAVRLPTLTDMVTGTYAQTEARRPPGEEGHEDLAADRVRQQARRIGPT